MADILPCPDGAGSINNPNAVDQQLPPAPLVVVDPCVGSWEMGGDSVCAKTENTTQASYAAEILNINGAPLNIYKLLGVHEQGVGSILSQGIVFASFSAPGYPVSGINTSSWKSLQAGSGVVGSAFVGVDFGINALPSGSSEYLPVKPNWKSIGAVAIRQADNVTLIAKQVRVETTDGALEVGVPSIVGAGTGAVTVTPGPRSEAGYITVSFTSSTAFDVVYTHASSSTMLGSGQVGTAFKHPVASVTVAASSWALNDIVAIEMSYIWKRQGVFNLIQSGQQIVLNLQRVIKAKAVRVVPTLFTAAGNWTIEQLDVLDSPPTNINNVQDLFFNENRDRDYDKVPVRLKAQYQINSSVADLSKFGLNFLEQYSFVISFPQMVSTLGRPLVTGDVIELIPEMQYDQNLKPVRKFLEVVDTGWASEGFSPTWSPSLYRFTASQALPSQETRDIFGTIDTEKYLVADSFFQDIGIGRQVDTSALTVAEEIAKDAQAAVPEIGDDISTSISAVSVQPPLPKSNDKGQPEIVIPVFKQAPLIEDGIPPDDQPYGEGYQLPAASASSDGDWFRLYYPENTGIPARLYRFSAVKNKWLFKETDRRTAASSLKPSVRNILKSSTKQGLGKKTV